MIYDYTAENWRLDTQKWTALFEKVVAASIFGHFAYQFVRCRVCFCWSFESAFWILHLCSPRWAVLADRFSVGPREKCRVWSWCLRWFWWKRQFFSQRHCTNPGKCTAGTQCHGGLLQMIFLCTWVIFRWNRRSFSGVGKQTPNLRESDWNPRRQCGTLQFTMQSL